MIGRMAPCLAWPGCSVHRLRVRPGCGTCDASAPSVDERENVNGPGGRPGHQTPGLSLRAAAYYAPELDDPLWRAGCAWLGRDPETGAAVPQPNVPGLADITADPRRYGFHATLKPPMRLRTAFPELVDDMRRLAASVQPFELPALAVTELSGFLALCEIVPCPSLHALADAGVVKLDRHRAPAHGRAHGRRE